MIKLNKPSDITTLTEEQKNCLLTLYTIRGQYKASIGMGLMPIAAGLLLILLPFLFQWLAVDLPIDQHRQFDDFLNSWFIQGVFWFGGVVMLASLPYFARARDQYKMMRLASTALVEKGICVQLNNKQIWDGFSAHVKLTPT